MTAHFGLCLEWLETPIQIFLQRGLLFLQITVCDFPMYELLDQHRLMKEDSLKEYPKLLAFLDRFEALPSIQKYMSSDKFLRRPINSYNAGFK